jgi:hypothetical protein
MRKKWTRTQILRLIMECEGEGVPLTVGAPGISHSLYQAGVRVFGSWRNAIQAAGLPPERGNCGEKWPPSRILTIIRKIERRHHSLSVKELEQRYGSMVSAARRLFGSWSKAVLAAGVDPTKLQRVKPWTPDRVIECILTHALRGESLAARSMQPRSIVEAGRRFFGSWRAALETAGLDPKVSVIGTTAPSTRASGMAPATGTETARRPTQCWSREAIIAAIQVRLRQQKPLHASALYRDDSALYHAARRRFGNWSNALIAAGLSPDDHRRGPKGSSAPAEPGNESARGLPSVDATRPDHSM